MKTVKIIVCCHKKDIMANVPPFMPIHVGKAISNQDLGIIGDDEGENISAKNGSYCELTGMYWAWKNLKNVDVIGLCHYRRYFDFHGQCDSVLPETVFPTSKFHDIDLSVPTSVIESINDGLAYVVKPKFHRNSIYTIYCKTHISDDIKILESVIMTSQPEYIKKAWFDVMHRNCQLSYCNMFIMTWNDFDAYCSWLFPILAMLESQIDISHYSTVQGRIWGYMAERLMNVWFQAKNFKLKELPLIWFNDYPGNSSRSHIKYYRNLLRSKLALAIISGTYKNFRKSWE